jgi:Pectate lyase superfamily protein
MTMITKHISVFIIVLFSISTGQTQELPGATIPWTTYEAEQMRTTGTVLEPSYEPYRVETESSGQRCVKFGEKKQSIEFDATGDANSMVIRFSLPDDRRGNGTSSTLGVYQNGKLIRHETIHSHYAWLYGKYPFTNEPDSGKPRHFYDEIRIKNLAIQKGDVIRIQWDGDVIRIPRDDNGRARSGGVREGGQADYCIIDLVDLEKVAPPLVAPANSLSVANKRFGGPDSIGDYTTAFRNCIAAAAESGRIVWIPAGTFTITGDIVLPAHTILQGAGMWYSELAGDEKSYTNANKRVRLIGAGSDIHLADFAITGRLNYRSDKESNDGITGSYGESSTISRLWIEHTKVGMWIENSNHLTITGCRMRNTLADGINFCVGMAHSTIEDCTARGTGDDCFAIWPTTYKKQEFSPGYNLIIHCMGQLPYLANGAALYGGDSNAVRDCLFTDISQGSGILISTTFPTESRDKSINNNFSGTTVIRDCEIKNSGGFDHDWGWRAAVEICLDRRGISGIEVDSLTIVNSLSNGMSVVAKNTDGNTGALTNAVLDHVKITNYGLGVTGKYGLFISGEAHGALAVHGSDAGDIRNESGSFIIN